MQIILTSKKHYVVIMGIERITKVSRYITKLHNLQVRDNESIDIFIERFKTLQQKAEIDDHIVLCKYFLVSIPPEVYKSVSLCTVNSDSEQKHAIDYMINKTGSTWDTLVTPNKQNNTKKISIDPKSSAKYSKSDKNTATNFNRQLHCKFHPLSTTHNTEQCI
jgi:hypothetical protein